MPALAERMSRLEAVLADPLTMDVLGLRLAEGEKLRAVAAAWQVPYPRLLAWILCDEGRQAQYVRALELHAHHLVAETVEIADAVAATGEPVAVQAAKLRIETRFKIAAHHARSLYGESKGGGGTTVNVLVQRGASVIEASPGAPPVEVEAGGRTGGG